MFCLISRGYEPISNIDSKKCVLSDKNLVVSDHEKKKKTENKIIYIYTLQHSNALNFRVINKHYL